MGEIVEFPSNGKSAQGYLATPGEGGTGPGLIVIQEYWGLVPHIKHVADRFAAAGFVALAPDLYHGETATEPDDAAKKMMAMKIEQTAKDLSGAVDFVLSRSSTDHIGVVGFCMGGGLALWLATLRPEAVAAVVVFYGVIPWPEAQPDYSKLSAAVQGHYASEDESASPAAVRELEEKLRSLEKEVEMHIYPESQHAFFNYTRPEVYNPEAAAAAWALTITFLESNLGF